MTAAGQIVVLNGAPRSGKSAIVKAIQHGFDGPWMNIGVDVARLMTPERFQPGIGLRPGEPAHRVAPLVPALYAALYGSIAAHSEAGLNVVVDVGHHHPGILSACARRLDGLPAIFVGVRCPIEVIMERRGASPEGTYVRESTDEPVPAPVLRWQREVHLPGIYDLEVDTSVSSPEECAEAIRRRLEDPAPATAFHRLAQH